MSRPRDGRTVPPVITSEGMQAWNTVIQTVVTGLEDPPGAVVGRAGRLNA